ncbi:SPOR domain-containing protein [Roseateles sp. DB2]|uniref:SPOR domain-containing protein n=1 Tax=Roseateles sp. DB2 TaxID=3453717 RepID=UPI003EED58B4
MSKAEAGKQRGGFVLGLIVGLLLGLAIALGVALYITKVPIPFVNKVPQRTAEQDAEEAARNKNWDPNAPLAGKAARSASGVLSPAAPASTPLPQEAVRPPEKATDKPVDKPVEKTTDKPVDKVMEKVAEKTAEKAAADAGSLYYVQVGAFLKAEDAEAQRAKLAMAGFASKVYEKEQSGRTVYRVRIGPLENRDEAEGQRSKVEAAGMEANLARVAR